MNKTLLLVSLVLPMCIGSSGYAQVKSPESTPAVPGVGVVEEKKEVKSDTVEVSLPVGPLFSDSSKVKKDVKKDVNIEVKTGANDIRSKDSVSNAVTDINKVIENVRQKPDSTAQVVSSSVGVSGVNYSNADSITVKPLVGKVDTVKQKIKSLEDVEKLLELKMISYVVDIGLESIWSTQVSSLVVPVQVSDVSADAIRQYESGGSDDLLSGMSVKKDAASDSAALVKGDVEKDMTDDRFNPVRYTKEIGSIPDQYLVQMDVISDDRFGCRYLIPVDWKGYSYKRSNVVGYFFKEGVVMLSVGYAAYKELNVWAGLQEAIFMGKNYIPVEDQTADAFLTKKMSVDQAYFGRYFFGGFQYSVGHYKLGDYQFSLIVKTKPGVLQAKELLFLNHMMVSFLGGTPAEVLPEYFDRSDVTYEQVYSDSEAKASQSEEKKTDSGVDDTKAVEKDISKKGDLKKKSEADKEKSDKTKVKIEAGSSDVNTGAGGEKSTASKKNRQTKKKK